MKAGASARLRLWPRTLFARLTLILFAGLALAHALSFALVIYERGETTTTLMLGYMELDVASSVALLDRLPAAERAEWLPRLERRSYGFLLGPGSPGGRPDQRLSAQLEDSVEKALGRRYALTANIVPDGAAGASEHLQIHLRLRDGAPLTIDVQPKGIPMSSWLVPLLLLQLALLALLSWWSVRLATRPLAALAQAADALGPDLRPSRMAEDGPAEVARAATAFNAMQDRMALYMAERMQILAAISHDLQTPITRMRLRADLMDDDEQRGTLVRNLREMEELVREGVTYARTLHGASEEPVRLDVDALLGSLVYDYADAAAAVTLRGAVGAPMLMRPVALRRILVNLIDNALKFGAGAAVEVRVENEAGAVTIVVLDQGPGIPVDKLDTVFQPFYRIEGSRNRDGGGTGLGLAIARQLAQAIEGALTLHNRAGGGLEARLALAPAHQAGRPA